MVAPYPRFWLREVPAALTVLILVGGLALFYYWIYPRPREQDRRLSGQIIGFHGALNRAQFGNTVRASVRLHSGLTVQVPIPRSGPVFRCRKGDAVALIRNGGLYRVAANACDSP
jgi:hypothetical protein